ncbi:MAG TPA: protein kinase [Candidatus Polarisedimenticolia bacterium]|nr:protein kinase [Candidatus Polarisedimenticolia bacterium]
MPLTPGGMLAHYRLVEKIGEGGMGVVYEALDTRLSRKVAIKILPDAFARDPQRLARFEREARLLASLSHPGIAAIHGIEEADGVRFLVLEMVAGETLQQRIARGPVPPPEAASMARAIAEGMEAAHERGVIHRDLKPANIKITPDGKVKLLDFGLAKALEAELISSSGSIAPTMTSDRSLEGMLIGTAAYMSPEQARGRPLDRRTDIWSFGAVLFEMLTGRQAFGGETVTDCLARILEREPDWGALPKPTPPRLAGLLRRCLQKDPGRRLRDIGDARLEIEEILGGAADDTPGGAGPAAPGTDRAGSGRAHARLVAMTILGAVLGAIAAVTATRLLNRAIPPAREIRLTSVARLTHDLGVSEWPTWSPDGSSIAFASDRGGDFEIYVRRVEGGQEINVTNDPGQDFQPSFSPDGETIAFVSTRSSRSGMIKIGATVGLEFRTYGGDLWTVPALGGQARRIAEDANDPAWNPDGRHLGYISGREEHRSILEVAAEGGPPKAILSEQQSAWEIHHLRYVPGGQWLSFETQPSSVWILPIAGGTPRLLFDGMSHVWDGTGRRIFYLSRNLEGGASLRMTGFDPATGTVRGEGATLGVLTGLLRDLAVSDDGRRLAVAEVDGSMNLSLLPLSADGSRPAGPEVILNSGQVIDRYPAFSPDGRRIAFTSDRLGPMDVWILDRDTGRQNRLRLPGQALASMSPQWLPDGRRLILLRAFELGVLAVWKVAVDGSEAEELLERSKAATIDLAVSNDGKRLAFSFRRDGFLQIDLLDLATKERRPLTTSASDKYVEDWSPDGRFIAYSCNEGGTLQTWRVDVATGREERLTSGTERMRHASYGPDGSLYVQPSHRNVGRIPGAGGPFVPVTAFPESSLFMEEPIVSPDGRFLAYSRSHGGASLWLLTIGTEVPGRTSGAGAAH